MMAFRLRPWVRRSILVLLAVASLGIQTLVNHSHPVLASSLIADACFFIGGIIVCDLAIASDLWKDRRSPRWDVIGCIALAAGYSISIIGFWSNAAMSILFGFAVVAALRGTVLARLMAARWLTAIGGMCYTIYLLHVPLIYLLGHIIARAMRWPHLWMNVLVAIILLPPPLLVACSLFFLVIEKPCMNKRWPADLVRFVLVSRQENAASEAVGV
jgi:peptidoglycan/LPS O-acetylase OafA/YrhL